MRTALFFKDALLQSGWVSDVRIEIVDGTITSVETDAHVADDDERHAIGLPGMPNLHSHAFQRGMAGLAERKSADHETFWDWREVMYRFALALTPDDMEAVAALAYAEMLESGFTRVGEFHYLHHDRDGSSFADPAEMAIRIIAVAHATGIGLTLLPAFYAHGGFGGAPPEPSQRRFICDIDGFARIVAATRQAAQAHPGTVVGVAPHSLRAVTPDELKAIRPLAGDGPIHIHAAEQLREVEDCLAWSGRRPVEWLLEHAGLDGRSCLIHATHSTADEVQRMAKAGVVVGLCPITEANLGDGVFSAPDFTASGGLIGIGTDSNVLIGVADELRQLEYAQRLQRRQRNVMTCATGLSTGRALFETAAHGGSIALGVPAAVLAPGAAADIVSLDAENTALIERPGDQALDAWIFSAKTHPVDCVWVGGRKWVEGGRHRDREAIVARYRRSVARL
jgi:formimidoylglutamate deiminase